MPTNDTTIEDQTVDAAEKEGNSSLLFAVEMEKEMGEKEKSRKVVVERMWSVDDEMEDEKPTGYEEEAEEMMPDRLALCWCHLSLHSHLSHSSTLSLPLFPETLLPLLLLRRHQRRFRRGWMIKRQRRDWKSAWRQRMGSVGVWRRKKRRGGCERRKKKRTKRMRCGCDCSERKREKRNSEGKEKEKWPSAMKKEMRRESVLMIDLMTRKRKGDGGRDGGRNLKIGINRRWGEKEKEKGRGMGE